MPSRFTSASSRNPLAARRDMNGEMSWKLTTPSWFTSPGKNVGAWASPGDGVAAIQLEARLGSLVALLIVRDCPLPSALAHGKASL